MLLTMNINYNTAGIELLPVGLVFTCPNGGQLAMTCTETTNRSFLQWIVTPHETDPIAQLLSITTINGTKYEWMINGSVLTFIKVSNRLAMPLVSTMVVENATNVLNGTNVTCIGRDAADGEVSELAVSTIRVIDPLKGSFVY